eukprot:TRINITY_DN371_c0_g1_i1.p2 TRINITY_DN371_c0_g1~~TRINITY_DN371_c0_g1_i1.p2  ORF type:complete len:224 (+),score=44.18 TRINITY_DN371_c0_g1_i1:155-826(+)
MRSVSRAVAGSVSGAFSVPRRFGKVLPGLTEVTERSGGGVERLPTYAYRSPIPCPEGVSTLYHQKWASLYDMLSDNIAPFFFEPESKAFPPLDRRTSVSLTSQLVDFNFGADWRDSFATWHSEVFCQMYPDRAEESKAFIARQLKRLELTQYATSELADGCADGVPEDIDAKMLELSVAASVNTYQEMGEEKFKNKLAYEAEIHGWSPAAAEKYLEAVKANVK